jgi:sigma-E factor negative regulatory protein RseC
VRQVQGVVQSVTGGIATVAVTVSTGGCGRCHEPGGCGGQNLSRSLCAPVKTIDLANTANAKVGELVFVQIDESTLRGFTTRVYVFPVIAVLLGAGIGNLLTDKGSIGAVLGAIAGFALAFLAGTLVRSASARPAKLISQSEASSIDR